MTASQTNPEFRRAPLRPALAGTEGNSTANRMTTPSKLLVPCHVCTPALAGGLLTLTHVKVYRAFHARAPVVAKPSFSVLLKDIGYNSHTSCCVASLVREQAGIG